MHKFYCQHCGQHIETDESLAGMTAQCPSCSKEITIPNNSKIISKDDVTSAITSDVEQVFKQHEAIISKGSRIGLHDGYKFPDSFCIKCCKPSFKRKKKEFSYTPPLVLLLIIMPIILIIVVLCITRRKTINFGLCNKHNEHYKRILIAKWSVFALIASLIFLLIVNGGGQILTVLLCLSILSLIGLFCIPCPISITGMKNGYTYFKGGSRKIITMVTMGSN